MADASRVLIRLFRRPTTLPTSRIRKVSTNGGIRWHSAWVNVSHLLGGEYIGLEEVADDVWAVYFGPVSLGWLHVRKLPSSITMDPRPVIHDADAA